MGRVFRQIKGRIPPDSAFLFPALVSIRETSGNGMVIRGLCPRPLACACTQLLHIPLCWPAAASADHSPLVNKPHRLLSSPFSPAFLKLEHLSLYTHPPLSSHLPPSWRCPLRGLQSTGHPDTVTLTQPLAQLVCCVSRSLSHNRPRATEIKGLCPIYPQPIHCPTQEPPFEILCFPSAKILILDFLPSDHPPFLFPTCTHRM